MNIQYISDNKGKTTGIFIPISEWNKLKSRFKDIEEINIPDWQLKEVRERLNEYKNNSDQFLDFDTAMNNIEKVL